MEQRQCLIKFIQNTKDALFQRPSDKRIDDFLDTVFNEYNDMLHQVEGYRNLAKLFEIIENVERKILQSLKDYFNGHLYGAIGEIDFLLQDIDLADGFNTSVLKINDIWYRGRLVEENSRLYKKKEMFHIPNYMREKVNNQRFSLNGYPCLYLGKSIWACWEELNEPHLDDICFSALKLTQDIKVLDLSIPTKEQIYNKTSDEIVKLLITMPLIFACSVKTINEKASFKSEYVVPQLLMANLINSNYFDGYVFSSTKRNPALKWKEDYLQNVVLPIDGDFDEDGLCISLKEKFLITDSISYKYEFLKSTISNMIALSEQEIEDIFNEDFHDNNNENKEENMYPRALFGQMEDILKKEVFSVIS